MLRATRRLRARRAAAGSERLYTILTPKEVVAVSLSRAASSAFSDAGSGVKERARRVRGVRLVAALAAAAAFVALAQGARAQLTGGRTPTGGPGGEHEIYGEFKVDESK